MVHAVTAAVPHFFCVWCQVSSTWPLVMQHSSIYATCCKQHLLCLLPVSKCKHQYTNDKFHPKLSVFSILIYDISSPLPSCICALSPHYLSLHSCTLSSDLPHCPHAFSPLLSLNLTAFVHSFIYTSYPSNIRALFLPYPSHIRALFLPYPSLHAFVHFLLPSPFFKADLETWVLQYLLRPLALLKKVLILIKNISKLGRCWLNLQTSVNSVFEN